MRTPAAALRWKVLVLSENGLTAVMLVQLSESTGVVESLSFASQPTTPERLSVAFNPNVSLVRLMEKSHVELTFETVPPGSVASTVKAVRVRGLLAFPASSVIIT